MQSKNKILIAAAGSGKTTYLVEETIKQSTKNILIVTFTNKNKEEILKKYIELQGYIPANVDVKTWYSFLLAECIRPYQNVVYSGSRIESVFFRDEPVNRYIKKSNIKGYYLNGKNQIDKDRISDFATQCIDQSGGRVLKRLEEMYDCIFIDEVQDMSGYDLDIFHLFFISKINTILVGDIRQATYSTSNTNRYKKYKGLNVIRYFEEMKKRQLCTIEGLNTSRRCNQAICDFSDNLFSFLPRTKSLNDNITGHDGLFIINNKDVEAYRERFNPQVLRYDARVRIDGAVNFGESKGLTFDRVLIKPTKKMEQYLKSGIHTLDDVSLAKFYVAVTRARYSVTFISDINSLNVTGIVKYTFD
ncbi:UvrD-helicase domain-containing protein [Peribacillus frigoritolerans]|uniref:UvrD-helicase domain-containing protein n=1 Tax=Peribacillus frigoritolerans TaxID=450367 RepID=UPI00207A3D9B|nr:UvrD-helicase domain-containing protein [Peribacillus frigoritolerans]MEE3953493.1 UvrD-helicase domain-containing protein [Peribacillus frigoritolerans]USK63463.1 UvrD-helicase domain-containing protein [Peribacillus frigoritolerans]